MKKTDTQNVIIVTGENNTVNLGETRSHHHAIVIAVIIAVALAVLTVSHCCPELLAEFVRWIIGTAIGN